MRVQLDFPRERVSELKRLMEKGNLKTYNDLFDNALTLMKWAVQEAEKGRSIGSFDEGEDLLKELVMPFLQYAARSKEEPTRIDSDPPVAVGQ
jgi:hypothetical protein